MSLYIESLKKFYEKISRDLRKEAGGYSAYVPGNLFQDCPLQFIFYTYLLISSNHRHSD